MSSPDGNPAPNPTALLLRSKTFWAQVFAALAVYLPLADVAQASLVTAACTAATVFYARDRARAGRPLGDTVLGFAADLLRSRTAVSQLVAVVSIWWPLPAPVHELIMTASAAMTSAVYVSDKKGGRR